MIRMFIGYDHVESLAYHTFAHSIMTRSSEPVSIAPVMLSHLKDALTRDRDPLQSNDFAFSRFLVPWMCNYEGWAIFADCDMLCQADIAELWAMRDESKAVQVVKHFYLPKNKTKYLGNIQLAYHRKNWSSVIIFNNAKCKALTPEYVNTAAGLDLHRFNWLQNEDIGELPIEWNWLVGEYLPNTKAKILHWTVGGPWFKEYESTDHANAWYDEYFDMMHVKQKGGVCADGC